VRGARVVRRAAARPLPGGEAMAALLCSRALVWVAGVVGVLALGSAAPQRAHVSLSPPWDVLAAPATRWDAAHYLAIASHGYAAPRDTAFFPLYPLLVRALGWVVRSDVAAAVALSLGAFAVGLVAVQRLAKLELGDAAARRTVWLLALFPAGIFFSAAYTESLFLALCAGSLLAARRGRWAGAAGLAALAGATRNSGVLLAVPLALLYLYGPRSDAAPLRGARGVRPRYPVDRRALLLLIVPAGLLAYLAYCWARFDDPLISARVQSLWGRSFQGPLSALWLGAQDAVRSTGTLFGGGAGSGSARRQLALCAVVAFALLATAGALRRLPAAYGAFAALTLAVALSAPLPNAPLSSTPRFIAVIFPLFMWLGWALRWAWAYRAVLAAFALGLAYASAWFSSWRFVS
jgi:hypothetical protein